MVSISFVFFSRIEIDYWRFYILLLIFMQYICPSVFHQLDLIDDIFFIRTSEVPLWQFSLFIDIMIAILKKHYFLYYMRLICIIKSVLRNMDEVCTSVIWTSSQSNIHITDYKYDYYHIWYLCCFSLYSGYDITKLSF